MTTKNNFRSQGCNLSWFWYQHRLENLLLSREGFAMEKQRPLSLMAVKFVLRHEGLAKHNSIQNMDFHHFHPHRLRRADLFRYQADFRYQVVLFHHRAKDKCILCQNPEYKLQDIQLVLLAQPHNWMGKQKKWLG